MGSITPTPTAEKGAAFTLAVAWKGGTNSSKMGNITHTLTAEKGAAFTLAVVWEAAPTSVKWAA